VTEGAALPPPIWEKSLIPVDVIIRIPRGWKKLSFHSLIVVEMVELDVIQSDKPGERRGSNCAWTLLGSGNEYSLSPMVSRCLEENCVSNCELKLLKIPNTSLLVRN
jgi:hypothetical protein